MSTQISTDKDGLFLLHRLAPLEMKFLTGLAQIILATRYLLSRMKLLLKRRFGIPMSFFVVILLSGLVTGLGGCGYTTRSTLPTEFKTIAVKNFVNKIEIQTASPDYKTYYPGLEIEITNAIIDRFIYDGNLRIAKEEDADLVLEGELIDYLRQPLRYTEADEVEEYRLSLVVNVVLKDREGNILRSRTNFVGDTTYHISGSLAKTEATALDDAASDLARRIVNLVVEAW